MTTTDDLHTRAREAAERWVEDASWADVDEEQYPEFVAGFLAAYEQLPGREEIAREVAYWAPTWDDAGSIADVVLTLIRGAES